MGLPILVALILARATQARAESFGEMREMAATAAPEAVSASATYHDLDADGVLLQIRAGSSGWWCIAPSLYRPGPAVPMCGGAVTPDWLQAWIEQAELTPGAPGIIYALAGGCDASPFKARPDGNLPWLETGPMVMVVNRPEAELALFRATERPDTSAHYVMWPDSPFGHLRRPVE